MYRCILNINNSTNNTNSTNSTNRTNSLMLRDSYIQLSARSRDVLAVTLLVYCSCTYC